MPSSVLTPDLEEPPIPWTASQQSSLPALRVLIIAHVNRLSTRLDRSQYYRYAALARLCLLYTSPSPRDRQKSRMPSSA